jgi:hypothetical protein
VPVAPRTWKGRRPLYDEKIEVEANDDDSVDSASNGRSTSKGATGARQDARQKRHPRQSAIETVASDRMQSTARLEDHLNRNLSQRSSRPASVPSEKPKRPKPPSMRSDIATPERRDVRSPQPSPQPAPLPAEPSGPPPPVCIRLRSPRLAESDSTDKIAIGRQRHASSLPSEEPKPPKPPKPPSTPSDAATPRGLSRVSPRTATPSTPRFGSVP